MLPTHESRQQSMLLSVAEMANCRCQSSSASCDVRCLDRTKLPLPSDVNPTESGIHTIKPKCSKVNSPIVASEPPRREKRILDLLAGCGQHSGISSRCQRADLDG